MLYHVNAMLYMQAPELKQKNHSVCSIFVCKVVLYHIMSKNVMLKFSYMIGECVAENLPLKFTLCVTSPA